LFKKSHNKRNQQGHAALPCRFVASGARAPVAVRYGATQYTISPTSASPAYSPSLSFRAFADWQSGYGPSPHGAKSLRPHPHSLSGWHKPS
jgi:hypothetical protein